MPEVMKKRTVGYRGIGRVAFLARRDAIQQRVSAGWPLKAIYDDYADTLGITYGQFCRYVGRFITPLIPGPRPRAVPPAPAAVTLPGLDERPPKPDADEGTDVGRSDEPTRSTGGEGGERRFRPHDKIQRPGDFERLTGSKPPR